MKIHPKKCEFAVTLIVYLGHKILPNGIMAHWAKVVGILEMPNPSDVHTFKSFIRPCNYYKIYVQDFSKVFILHIDWSALSIGVILSQLDEKNK
jgi:hypothetical protein